MGDLVSFLSRSMVLSSLHVMVMIPNICFQLYKCMAGLSPSHILTKHTHTHTYIYIYIYTKIDQEVLRPLDFKKLHLALLPFFHYDDILKSPAYPLFAQLSAQAQKFKENIKAPRHWPLCGENVSIWWRRHVMYLQQRISFCIVHYNDVIMGSIASQITSLASVY